MDLLQFIMSLTDEQFDSLQNISRDQMRDDRKEIVKELERIGFTVDTSDLRSRDCRISFTPPADLPAGERITLWCVEESK